MADMPIAYCKAKCCAFCSAHTDHELRYWAGLRKRLVPWCTRLLQIVDPKYRCSRFRWDAEHRPPTPEKPATVGEEVPDA